jgi:hypothetical protein
VFANGVRLLGDDEPGLPVRVSRVSADRGHQAVAVNGAASLLAHVRIDDPTPATGDSARAVFDPALSAVLPRGETPTGRGAPTDIRSADEMV